MPRKSGVNFWEWIGNGVALIAVVMAFMVVVMMAYKFGVVISWL